MSFLKRSTIVAAQEHAKREFPKESCGIVVGDEYIPCFNYAADPAKDFVIAPEAYLRAMAKGEIRAVLHSHPKGPYYPTAADMQGQLQTAVVWGIIVTDGERVAEPVLWGDQLEVPALLGREFMHGVTDCYSLVRDCYRAGKDELAKQGVSTVWPLDSVVLPDVPRDDGWWRGNEPADLYLDHFKKFGFREIALSDARPGDAFLMKVRSDRVNHAGVIVADDLIMHHLPNRLSRREPANSWARHAQLFVRHETAA